MSVRLPGLLDSSLRETARLQPVSGSLTLKLTGAWEASITLPEDGPAVAVRDWISLYTRRGFTGVFRVTNIQRSIRKQRALTLLHGIDILSDSVWAAKTDFTGTKLQFITALLNQQTHLINGVKPWVLGVCEDPSSWSCQVNYDRLSDLLAGLEDESGDYYFTYDQSVFPWVLSYVRKPAGVDSEFRLTRNVRSLSVTYNDADLCTCLILAVKGVDGVTVYHNAEAEAAFGVVAKTATIEASDGAPAAWAQAFLQKRAEPSVQIQIDGDELREITGDAWDETTVGRLSRVSLPDDGYVYEERVVSVTYPDIWGDPSRVTVSLANALPRFSESILEELRSASRSAGAAAQAVEEQAEQQAQQYQHWTEENEVYRESVYKIMGVELNADGTVKYVQATDEQGNPVYDEQGNPVWETDAAGNPVPVYNEQSDGSLASKVLESAQRLEQTVTYTSLNTTLGSYLTQTAWETRMGNYLEVNKDGVKVMKGIAQVVTMINEQDGTGTVLIEGDKVKIDGDTTINNKLRINSSGVLQILGQAYFQSSTTATKRVNINDGTVHAPKFQVEDGSIVFSRTSGTAGTVTLDMDNVSTIVTGFGDVSSDQQTGVVSIPYKTVRYQTAGSNSQTINFNIADMAYHINALSAARSSIDFRYQWGSPVSETDQSQDHGKKYTLTMASASLGYATQEEQETGEGSSETVEVWHQTRGPLSITSANITGVYDTGFTDGQANANAVIKANSITYDNSASYVSNKLFLDISATPQLVLGDGKGNSTSTDKTASVDTVEIAAVPTAAALSRGSFENGKFTITGSSGNVRIGGSGGAGTDIPISVTSLDLPISKSWYFGTYGQSSQPAQATGSAYCEIDTDHGESTAAVLYRMALTSSITTPTFTWDSANHQYTYALAGEVKADNVKIMAPSGTATPLVPTDAINYGKTLVEQRSATGLSDTIILASTDTGTSDHTAYVEYDDDTDDSISVRINASAVYTAGQNSVTAALVSISAVPSGSTSTALTSGGIYDLQRSVSGTVASHTYYTVPSAQTRTAENLAQTIVLPATHTGIATISGNIVEYDDDTTSVNFPVVIDASAVYTAGFGVCHDSIGLSQTTQTISAGDSITIYPTAKASTTDTEASSITSAGITITAASGSGDSGVRFIVTSGGTLTVYDVNSPLTSVGALYPNTPIPTSSITIITVMTRQVSQITYDGRTGWVNTSYLSTTPGATSYPTRIGWIDGDASYAERTVVEVAKLNQDNTYTSGAIVIDDPGSKWYTVKYLYDTGNPSNGTIQIDASGISSANIAARPSTITTNGTYYASADNLDGYSSVTVAVPSSSGEVGGIDTASIGLTTNSSTVYGTWTADKAETLTSKYCRIKIDPLDSSKDSYYLKIDASAIAGDGETINRQTNRTYTVTSNDTYTIYPSSGYDTMDQVSLVVAVPDGITTQRSVHSLEQIVLGSSDTSSNVQKTVDVFYDDDSEDSVTVGIDASAVYQAGVAYGASTTGYQLTTVELAGSPNYFRSINVPTGTTSVNAVSGSGALYQVNSNGTLYVCSVEVSRVYSGGYLYKNEGSAFERVPGTGTGSWFYVDGDVSSLMRKSVLKVARAETTAYTVATGTRSAYVTDSSGTIVFYSKGQTVSDRYYIKTT